MAGLELQKRPLRSGPLEIDPEFLPYSRGCSKFLDFRTQHYMKLFLNPLGSFADASSPDWPRKIAPFGSSISL